MAELRAHMQRVLEQENLRASLRADLDDGTGAHVFTVTSLPEFEPALNAISTRVGDVVHNLRSALDHTIYSFALQEGNGKIKDREIIQFIHLPSQKYLDKRLASEERNPTIRLREQLSSAQWEFMVKYQPFHPENAKPWGSWAGAKDIHWLTHLMTMSNEDKHRRLIELGAVSGLLYFDLPKGVEVALDEHHGRPLIQFPEHWLPLEVGATVAQVKLAGSGVHANIESVGQCQGDIVLQSGAPAVQCLRQIFDFVKRVLVDAESIK